MEEIKTTTEQTAPAEAPTEATAAEIKNTAGKTFTQDEVNQIVSERLARERARANSPTAEETKRTKELDAKANNILCREFLLNNDYPHELLEILDTSDAEAFKEKATKLYEAMAHPKYRNNVRESPRFQPECIQENPIIKAFGRDVKHELKKPY